MRKRTWYTLDILYTGGVDGGMSASIVESNAEFVTLQIVIPLHKTFLETEVSIQSVLNEAGAKRQWGSTQTV